MKNKKLLTEIISVGLVGILIFAYGIKTLLQNKVISTGGMGGMGREAEGPAAFFISVTIIIIVMVFIYSATKKLK